MKRKIGIGLMITLLMITSTITFGTTVAQEGTLEVVKKVQENGEWLNETEVLIGEYVNFSIEVTYHGPFGNFVNNTVVTDTLPPGLDFVQTMGVYGVTYYTVELNENIVEYTFPDTMLYDGDSLKIVFKALTIDFGENVNLAEVVAEEHCTGDPISGSDTATVNIEGLEFDKQVWDTNLQDWADELDHVILGEQLRFRISLTYHSQSLMKCLMIGDLLPECCLEYYDNVYVEINGEEILEGDTQYPEIFLEGETVEVCGEEYIFPEDMVVWDWREKSFELKDDETVVIEFDANVTSYCEEWVTNYACSLLWNCGGDCEVYYESDEVLVNCSAPATYFIKFVGDGEWYGKEITAVVGDTVKFALALVYFGNSKTFDVELVDYLPCCLEFTGESSMELTNISADNKTLWWNFTVQLNDTDYILIEYDALVVNNECCEGVNFAEITLTECENITNTMHFEDSATVRVEENTPPGYPILTGDTEGETNEDLEFQVTSYDYHGHDVYYMFDWGDETSGWLGPYTEGIEKEFTHSWDAEGTYEVKAKSKDIHGAESLSWSNILTVEITAEEQEPEENIEITTVKGGLNKITATIKNNGEEKAEVNWTIEVEGKLLNRKNVETNDSVNITAGQEEEVEGAGQSGRFGFGRCTITITADAEDYGNDAVTKNGFIIGPFIIIRPLLGS